MTQLVYRLPVLVSRLIRRIVRNKLYELSKRHVIAVFQWFYSGVLSVPLQKNIPFVIHLI